MTTTEVLLTVAIVGGFALLLLTPGAFAVGKHVAGVATLVLAGVCFVGALVLMARVSSSQDEETRRAVLEKYDVTIQEWGNPLGTSPQWVVNKKEVHCEVFLEDLDDPRVKCDGKELPLRKQ